MASVLQDLPFCILNLALLLLTVKDRKNKDLDPADQMCNDEFNITVDFVLVLLILVTSIAALVYKVHPCPKPTAQCRYLPLCGS